jgi:hypothetical protein
MWNKSFYLYIYGDFNKMNCELMLTYDTPALRQTGSRNLTRPKTLRRSIFVFSPSGSYILSFVNHNDSFTSLWILSPCTWSIPKTLKLSTLWSIWQKWFATGSSIFPVCIFEKLVACVDTKYHPFVQHIYSYYILYRRFSILHLCFCNLYLLES